MTRERLPDRRQGVTEVLTYRKDEPGEVKFAVTFNWEQRNPWTAGYLKEAFCLAFKEGTDMQALLHHTCIITSVALQEGATMEKLAHALGEDNPEQPPGSIIGLIVRAGVVIDQNRPWPPFKGRWPHRKPPESADRLAMVTMPKRFGASGHLAIPAMWTGATNRSQP